MGEGAHAGFHQRGPAEAVGPDVSQLSS